MRKTIYVLINESDDIVTIGITDNVKQHLDYLNAHVHFKHHCEYAIEVYGANEIIHKINGIFEKERVSENAFKLNPKRIKKALSLISDKREVTPPPYEGRQSGGHNPENRKKKGPINLFEIGLKKGDLLRYVNDNTITATVYDGRSILFRNEITSLSDATKILLTEKRGYKIEAARGPDYWKSNGKTLSEIRLFMEE